MLPLARLWAEGTTSSCKNVVSVTSSAMYETVDRWARAPGEARSTADETTDRERRSRCQNARRPAGLEARRQPCGASTGRLSAREFHIGCSGWFYWHWRGDFCVADMPTGDWFTHYADCFKTVELNAPFYSGRLPPPSGHGFGKWSDGSLFTRSKRRNSLRTSNALPELRRWPAHGMSPPQLSLHASALGPHPYPVGPGPAERRGVPAPQLVG